MSVLKLSVRRRVSVSNARRETGGLQQIGQRCTHPSLRDQAERDTQTHRSSDKRRSLGSRMPDQRLPDNSRDDSSRTIQSDAQPEHLAQLEMRAQLLPTIFANHPRLEDTVQQRRAQPTERATDECTARLSDSTVKQLIAYATQ
ncbi:hypothetical protein B0A48_17335 [Cryoendolithus antarcticus]|uniref:Uncharacterized protein n=1 Tax=Cryoendolithus antarcticus TaxID=1507870 RepID=A0A1V8SBY8_9PEZI|nr:hypothetical protein B0A48_17335 [Cryoendolithus antarcticus]